jgi:hypothetical protein
MMRATLDSFEQEIAQSLPLERIGKPEDVAAACLWLSGKGGEWVTGWVQFHVLFQIQIQIHVPLLVQRHGQIQEESWLPFFALMVATVFVWKLIHSPTAPWFPLMEAHLSVPEPSCSTPHSVAPFSRTHAFAAIPASCAIPTSYSSNCTPQEILYDIAQWQLKEEESGGGVTEKTSVGTLGSLTLLAG